MRVDAHFQWHALLTAGQFLTRVPLPGGMAKPGADPRLLSAAVGYFPLVGTCVGLSTGSAAWLALQFWPAPIAVVLALVFEACLTGAFHEDAVADSCDAFGGGWTRDDVLRIMKDSRVGSFGALGLGLTVALRWAGLAALPPEELLLVAALAGGLGRLAVVALMLLVPPVPRAQGSAKDVGERVGRGTLALAAALTLPTFLVALDADPIRALAALAIIAVVTLGWGRYVEGRIGGVTGDCLGACAMFGQVAVVLAWTAGRGLTHA